MEIIKLPIPSEMKDERYFQICDVNKYGYGSFSYLIVSNDTTEEEIFNLACEKQTNEMLQKEEMYLPGMFRQPPKWRNTIKVKERTRKIKQLPEKNKFGKDYINEWTTKRNGLKFTIINNFIEIAMSNGSKYRGNGYKLGEKI